MQPTTVPSMKVKQKHFWRQQISVTWLSIKMSFLQRTRTSWRDGADALQHPNLPRRSCPQHLFNNQKEIEIEETVKELFVHN